MKFKKGDEVVIKSHNPSNSVNMDKQLETDFPVGTVHVVEEITRRGLTKTCKDKLKGKIHCDEEDIEFCKKSSDSQCVRIRNPHGDCMYNDCTHICYVEIEKI